jgi:Protein of unknown function (DUF630)/Protein of unknown function (DUF632)
MKEAVHSRHLLASAHADYLRSMRLAAASLSRFASGEPFLSISGSTPPVLLLAYRNQTTATAACASSSLPLPTPQPPPPPPPVPNYSPTPPTISNTKLPRILTRSTSSSRQQSNPNSNPPPRSYNLPHILSDSSPAPSTRKRGDINYPTRANLASTPSMSSSAWDWENFYPPSPPDSEYFDRRKAEIEAANQQQQQHHQQLREEDEFSDDQEEEEEEREEGEREFEEQEAQYMYNDQLKQQEDNDEMTCHEWDERYTSTSSSSTRSRSEGYDDTRSRSEACGYGHGYGYGVQSAQEIGRSVPTSEIAPPSSALTVGPGAAVHHRTLAEIAASIEEYFIKAAEAGSSVSELLETGRAQLDRSFSQLKSE